MTPVSSPSSANTDTSADPSLFYELLQQIPLQCFEKERLLESELIGVQVYPEKSLIVLRIKMSTGIPAPTYELISQHIKESIPGVQRVVLDVHYASPEISLADYLMAHEKDLMFCLTEESDVAEGWFTHYRMEPRENSLSFQVPHELARQQMDRKQCMKVLADLLSQRCGYRGPVELSINTDIVPKAALVLEETPVDFSAPSVPQNILIYGRKVTEPHQSMTVTDEQKGFVAQGEVIVYDQRQTKSGRHMVKMTLTDYSDSMDVIFFHENDGKFKGGIKERDWVKVRGDLRFDSRDPNEMILNVRDIMKIQAPETRMDRAVEKRVELHCHTQMSRMDGLSKIDRLIETAAKWGHKAIAITDHGVVQAYPDARKAAKENNIKLILGMEGYLVEEFKREKGIPIYHIILLVQNRVGLKNLYKLVSESHLKNFYKRPLIPRELLQKHREGLILGSACEQGEVWQTLLHGGKPVEEVAQFYDYIEIQPCENNEFMIQDGMVKSMEELQAHTRTLFEVGRKLGKMVVATGDSHFIDPRDDVYRKILHAGMGYGVERQAPLYLKTTEELKKDFAYFGEEIAHELVVTNPGKIADMIEEVEPLPTQTLSPLWEGADELLRETSIREAHRLYGETLPVFIEQRLQKELNAIINNKFSTLYVIAMKLVKKSLSDGYIVGSRGSVGSSFVAYLSGITEVNPLPPHYRCDACRVNEFPSHPVSMAGVDMPAKDCPQCAKPMTRDGFSIAFEVFMGFKGDKMPDIDLNFSGEYQHIAHKYVEELFGKDFCFRAGTISAVQDKIAFGFVKKFVEQAGRTARNAELNRLVKGCSGVSKTTGQHPGGIIILPKNMEITDVCPVQYPADNKDGDIITTHFDFSSMHDCLVKLDILGHDNPTSLKRLENMTGISALAIPLNDEKTMSLFSGVKALELKEKIDKDLGTLGVPEFGTKFAMDMLRDTRPTRFEHLVRLCGLAHGTDVWLGNAQDLIKQGTATLSTVISTRDDMLNDLMGRGMDSALAFKIMEDVRKGKGLKPDHEQAMMAVKTPSWYIDSCKKIKYIFPKAHAVAYCIMSFRIAWFKAHEPLAFYADYFTNKCFGFDATVACDGLGRVRDRIKLIRSIEKPSNKELDEASVLEVVEETYSRGFRFLPVDLYKSDARQFLIEESNGEKMIRPPLIGLPGLGDTAADWVVLERAKGPFTSIEEIQERCGVNKNVLEILKGHGCLKDMPDSKQVSLF
jgi:DNA polymerase-3 subunit alpha (Gram-positive type)